MENEEVFFTLGWIVGAAAIFGMLARLIRLPSIVAYLLAGLAIGPALGLVEVTDNIDLISHAGIVLLLFLVGLELSFERIKDVGPVAVVAGLGQVVFTALGGLGLCLLLSFTLMESLFLSVALTFSSTVVVVKILSDKGELDTLYGRIAVGIFLVQDLVVIVVLTVLNGLQAGSGEEGASNLVWGLVRAFLGMGLMLGIVLVMAKFVLGRIFSWVASSPGTVFIWSLCWCFSIVALAYVLDLSIELGAFFAGLSLAQMPHHRDLQSRVKPLMNFFVAVFFVALGMQMNPGESASDWFPILVLSLFVLVGNPLIFLFIIGRMGYSRRTAFLTSVTVAQISEFSLIFVASGFAAGLIGGNVVTITGMVGMITIAASAYLILYNGLLFAWLDRLKLLNIFGGAKETKGGAASQEWKDHIIIVGMNTLGKLLAKRLHEHGETVLALDTDPKKMRNLPCAFMQGSTDYMETLQAAGLKDAKLLISALQIEESNELLAYRCREAGVACCIHAIDLSVMENLLSMDVAFYLLPKVDGVKAQNRYLKQEGYL
ncbi:MAG: cation:proton antiporter [Verrucomicrobiales bacterium]